MGNPERWHRMAPLPEDIQARLKRLPELFAQTGVRLAYLFGSSTRKIGNDVDLAVMIEPSEFPSLYDNLCQFLGTQRLDAVNLSTADNSMSFEVISTGRLIFKIDDETENQFESRVLRTYQDDEIRRRKLYHHLREVFGLGN